MDFSIFSVRTYELFKEASFRLPGLGRLLKDVPKEETPMLKMYHWPT